MSRHWWTLDVSLYYFEFKVQFFASHNIREIKLPKLSCEPQRRPTGVQICEPFNSQGAPKISQAHICANGLQFQVGIKGKRCQLRHEAGERIAIEMITMSGISSPVGI